MGENNQEKPNKVAVREREFAERWSVHLNASKAYVEAGYQAANEKVARSAGAKLLIRDSVKRYLKEIWDARKLEYGHYKQILIEDAIGRLIIPITEVAEFGQRKVLDGGKTVYLSYVRFKDSTDIPPEVMKYVEEIRQNREGFVLKLTSRDKAVETLARLTGAYEPDKLDLGVGPIRVFPDDGGNGGKQLKDGG